MAASSLNYQFYLGTLGSRNRSELHVAQRRHSGDSDLAAPSTPRTRDNYSETDCR
jgi:hypothetical protein